MIKAQQDRTCDQSIKVNLCTGTPLHSAFFILSKLLLSALSLFLRRDSDRQLKRYGIAVGQDCPRGGVPSLPLSDACVPQLAWLPVTRASCNHGCRLPQLAPSRPFFVFLLLVSFSSPPTCGFPDQPAGISGKRMTGLPRTICKRLHLAVG